MIVKGDRAAAMLAAVRANSRESLPLTKKERMDAAWQLVRLPGKRLKVRTVAEASGVAPRTVDMMRKRWTVMVAQEKPSSGHWWRDRHDELPQIKDIPEITEKERRERVEQLAEHLRKAFGRTPWQDEQIVAEAVELALGTYKLRSMTEYLFAADEFANGEDGGPRETIREPEGAATNRDF